MPSCQNPSSTTTRPKLRAERLRHLEQDLVRREHDIGLLGWRLLRLIVRKCHRTGKRRLSLCFPQAVSSTSAPISSAALTASRLRHIGSSVPSLVPSRPCQIAAVTPSGILLRASSASLCVGTGSRTRWGSPLRLASMTNRAIACLPSSDLPMPVVILMALWGGSLRSSGSAILSRSSCQDSACYHDLLEHPLQHLPAVICGRACSPAGWPLPTLLGLCLVDDDEPGSGSARSVTADLPARPGRR